MRARVIAATAAVMLAAPAAASAAPKPRLFPSDALTVSDPSQLTGRRVNLPLPDCGARPSDCDDIRLINQLDGFDIDPRIEIAFGTAVDVKKATREAIYVQKAAGGDPIAVNRLVWSPARRTLYGQPAELLEEGTKYRLVVTGALSGRGATSTFTTMTATDALRRMREQLDSGSAYDAASIAPVARGITFDGKFPAATVLDATRHNDVGGGKFKDETVIISSRDNAGTFAFGSFEAPSWLAADRTIPQLPTGSVPPVRGKERIGVAVIVPAGTPPAGGWPVAIHGPGITRSKYDAFLAADFNARNGLATVAIDPVGHSYGPKGTIDIRTGGGVANLPMHGRATADVEGDGIDDEEMQAPLAPNPRSAIALRDGLRQTALDNMALVRAIQRGVDIDGDGQPDLSRDAITYYAVSLGGIYGTMFLATENRVSVGANSVPGGPILEIARLAPGFRSRVARELKNRRPSLLNGGWEGFTESTPLWAEPPVTAPARGAVAIQEVGSRTNWIDRSGSPDAYAPLLKRNGKKVMYQFAFGDQTVPNPTSATLVRAGKLQDVTSYYRNDRTPTASSDPHGYLLDPRITGRVPAQQEFATFLASGGASNPDPDGAGNVFEVPIADMSVLERLNYSAPLGKDAPPAETATDSRAAPAVRLRVRVTPRRLRSGRRVRLIVRVTSGGVAVKRARVSIGRHRARTNRSGRAFIRVRAPRAGKLRLTVRSGSRRATITLRVRH